MERYYFKGADLRSGSKYVRMECKETIRPTEWVALYKHRNIIKIVMACCNTAYLRLDDVRSHSYITTSPWSNIAFIPFLTYGDLRCRSIVIESICYAKQIPPFKAWIGNFLYNWL